MKLFKGMMYGAAAVATAATAQAADLPVAPEPVDYVRICDAYGNSFYYIPGTETCLRVGGRVRFDIRVGDMTGRNGSAWDSDDDVSLGWRSRAYLRLDSRTSTEFGLLRTYADLWWTSTSTGGDAGFGSTTGTSSLDIWEAYIQFGGFTFGKATSFYDNFNGYSWGSRQGAAMDQNEPPVLIGYTAGFGNGVSFGVAVEEDQQRREAIVGAVNASAASAGDTNGGNRIPNLVANLIVNQGWGSAGVYAMGRQVLSGGTGIENDFGWAVAADASFDLPMISSGTAIGFRAAYGQGASGYVNRALATDAVVTGGTNLSLTNAWGVLASVQHAWTPTITQALTGTYATEDANGIDLDRDMFSVHSHIQWSPVSGLAIGPEVEYRVNYNKGNTLDTDALTATFRVQRTF